MTIEDNEDFKSFLKFWICDQCHITGKYRGSAHIHVNVISMLK